MNKGFYYSCLVLVASVFCACSASNGSINPKTGLPENRYIYDFMMNYDTNSGMREISIYESWKGKKQRIVATLPIHDSEIIEGTPKTVYFDSCASMTEINTMDINNEVISTQQLNGYKPSCNAELTLTRVKNKILYEGKISREDILYTSQNSQKYTRRTQTEIILKRAF